MGPRPCGRGRRPPKAYARPQVELQWGHGLAAVDGSPAGTRGAAACRASMGPRPCGRGRTAAVEAAAREHELQWGHGLAAVDGSVSRPQTPNAPPSFNGATALRPWTANASAPGQVGGRASMGPRPCGRGRSGPPPAPAPLPEGFNGATALRPWTVEGARQAKLAAKASMGPRPCGRGRGQLERLTGILGRLQWGHGLAAVDGCRRKRTWL